MRIQTPKVKIAEDEDKHTDIDRTALLSLRISKDKKELYIKIFKQEFIRELFHLWDVANGRAQGRDDFTTKLKNLLLTVVLSIPAVQAIPYVSQLTSVVGFAISQFRDDSLCYEVNLAQDLDPTRLEIIADIVSREAFRRYETFIMHRLSEDPEEGVIPFAKVGVARVLEKLVRSHNGEGKQAGVNISEALLLSGLIEGRSGRFVEGWTNHSVKLSRLHKARFQGGKREKEKIDAEDVYARSGFRHFYVDVSDSKTKLNSEIYAREKKGSVLEKLKKALKGTKEEKTDLFNLGYGNFGYVKFRNKFKNDPKCGYAIMPMKVIERYEYQKQDIKEISEALKKELDLPVSIVPIDRKTVELYIKQTVKNPLKSLLDFVRDLLQSSDVHTVQCQADLSGLNLAGKNLSYTDLSGAIIGGDLTNTNFTHAYLIATQFIGVTSANGAKFIDAHCEFLVAEEIDFTGSDFTKANLSFAKIRKCNLTGCKTSGTQWYEAQLEGIKSDADLILEQKNQIKVIEFEHEKFRSELEGYSQKLSTLTEKFVELKERISSGKSAEEKGDLQDKLQNLEQQVQAVIIQQLNRASFEKYCKEKLFELEKSIQTADQTVDKEGVNDIRQQLKAIQSQLDSSRKSSVELTRGEGIYRFDSLIEDFNNIKKRLEQERTKSIEEMEIHRKKIEIQLSKQLDQLDERITKIEKDLKNGSDKLQEQKIEQLVRERASILLPMLIQQSMDQWKQQLEDLKTNFIQSPISRPKPLLDPRLIIPSCNLSFDHQIEEGSFGKIYLGRWNSQIVVIKALEGTITDEDRAELIRESQLMSRLTHPNVVRFYGASYETNRYCIVMEYMELGSLFDLLAKPTELTSEQIVDIALDIAQGLKYIHERGIKHRDLKSANILINKYYQAKITDFGLAKADIKSIASINKASQAIKWLAPECLKSPDAYKDYKVESDIYSYGVILWELITGKQPLLECKGGEESEEIIKSGVNREVIPEVVPYQEIIESCWQTDLAKRPKLDFIIEQLQLHKTELCYKQGLNAEKTQNFQIARLNYARSAEGGFAKALTNLGFLSLTGMGTKVDKRKAFDNFRKSAQRGHVRAMFNLALMLQRGDGIDKDEDEALKWYAKAAEKNHIKAIIELAKIKERKGKTEDLKHAYLLYKTALSIRATHDEEIKAINFAKCRCRELEKIKDLVEFDKQISTDESDADLIPKGR